MRNIFSVLGSILSKIGKSITFTRNLVFNLFFIFIIAIIIIGLQQQKDEPIRLKSNTTLVLALDGKLVDQAKYVDPFDKVIGELFDQKDIIQEIAVSDVVHVIHQAKTDNAINAIVLDLANLQPASITKLTDISDALVDFKTSDKPIYAFGDYFSQEQYFLASFADEILLNPAGGVLLQGYGSYSLYFKDAIEKLNLSSHVFRVGTYKSFVEPFTRNGMSAASKEAKLNWLNQLWDNYTDAVAKNRNISQQDVAPEAPVLLKRLKLARGNTAQYALQQHFVDQLLTREQTTRYLNKKLSVTNKDYSKINFWDYLAIQPSAYEIASKYSDPGIGIIFASGQILNGKQPIGTIGGKSLSDLLHKAKDNNKVKALVLRIDSPGGSAFASEQVRNALLDFKTTGKPVIVSMGSVTASGGYWIASAADEIWAKPTTITGSIGIFGMFATTEKLLAKLGIYSDGVGTTDYAGLSVNRALPAHMEDIIQLTIENGYQNFLNIVAEGRNMSTEDVDKIAQGRVWTGLDAKKLGLVDQLGDLDDAIASAAAKAQLTSPSLLLIQPPVSEKDRLLSMLTESMASAMLSDLQLDAQSGLGSLIKSYLAQGQALTNFSDPQGMYVQCLTCEVN